jgi:hypothetical protein
MVISGHVLFLLILILSAIELEVANAHPLAQYDGLF